MRRSDKRRQWLWTIILFGCLIWVHCSDDNPFSGNTDFEAEESFSYSLEVVEQSLFRLEGISGTIEIKGLSEGNTISITGMRRVQSYSHEDARERLQELKVQVQDLTSEVLVRTRQPQNTHGRNYNVDYFVTLPRNLRIAVGNISGNIRISSIEQNVSVNNVSGNVILNDISANAKVVTVSGTIDSRITLPVGGSIDLNAVSGSVRLEIPKNTSAILSASVTSGNIGVSNLVLANPVHTPTSLHGTCGSGEGTITLGLVSGIISIVGF